MKFLLDLLKDINLKDDDAPSVTATSNEATNNEQKDVVVKAVEVSHDDLVKRTDNLMDMLTLVLYEHEILQEKNKILERTMHELSEHNHYLSEIIKKVLTAQSSSGAGDGLQLKSLGQKKTPGDDKPN